MTGTPENPHGDNLEAIAWASMSPPGHGKSHDMLATYGARAIYVVKDLRGVRMAKALGIKLDTRHPAKGGQVLVTKDPGQITKLAKFYRKKYGKVPFHKRPYIAFAIDEFSGIFKRREQALFEEFGDSKLSNMLVYGAVKQEGVAIINSLLDLDCHVHGTFEYAGVKMREDKGIGEVRVKAQADLPGRQLGPALAYAFDVIASLRKAPERYPYPVEFTRDHASEDVEDKDRLNVLTHSTPLCTREILLSQGFWLPPFRSEGEERYIDTLTEKVQALLDPSDPDELQGLLRQEARKRVTPARPLSVVTNTFYRAVCRAELRRSPDFYASLLGEEGDNDAADDADNTTTEEE